MLRWLETPSFAAREVAGVCGFEGFFGNVRCLCWTGEAKFSISATRAQVAQLVEQRTENPRVAGSIPALGTIFPK